MSESVSLHVCVNGMGGVGALLTASYLGNVWQLHLNAVLIRICDCVHLKRRMKGQ